MNDISSGAKLVSMILLYSICGISVSVLLFFLIIKPIYNRHRSCPKCGRRLLYRTVYGAADCDARLTYRCEHDGWEGHPDHVDGTRNARGEWRGREKVKATNHKRNPKQRNPKQRIGLDMVGVMGLLFILSKIIRRRTDGRKGEHIQSNNG